MNYLNNLDEKIQNIKPSSSSTFFICPYNYVYNTQYPFIVYLLYKQIIQNKPMLSFLYIHFKEKLNKTIMDIKQLVNIFLDDTFEFKGFKKSGNDFYLFYECCQEYTIKKYNENDNIYWTTMYEIIHYQKCLHIPIHYSCFSFFCSNPDTIHITNEDNDIPLPITIYSLKNIIDLYTGYDISKNKIKIKHYDYIIHSKNVIRFVICNLKEFSNISDNTFYIDDIDELEIISE
tara:strand:- start:3961 stop:4656 length:696 start_codon:yes stop_codon:yes gene_type:complete